MNKQLKVIGNYKNIPIDYLSFHLKDLNFDQNALFIVDLVSVGGFRLHMKLKMEGEDFENWGDNDLPYVSNWILNQLGLEENLCGICGKNLADCEGHEGYGD